MTNFRTFITITTLALFTLVAAGCGNSNYDFIGMFDGQSPDPDLRFAESMEYNDAYGYRTIISLNSEYEVYVGTDMHVDTICPNMYHTSQFMTAFRTNLNAPVCIMLGDLINGQHNMQWVSDNVHDWAGLKKNEVFNTLGNHDAYFNQWADWRDIWHTSTYYFVVESPNLLNPLQPNKDLYICLESANGTLGTKQLKWFKNLLEEQKDADYRHRIVFTHTQLLKKDGSQGHTSNFGTEETYELLSVMADNNVDLFLSGHDHAREVTHYQGITSIVCDALEEHDEETWYMVATIGNEIKYEFVAVENDEK